MFFFSGKPSPQCSFCYPPSAYSVRVSFWIDHVRGYTSNQVVKGDTDLDFHYPYTSNPVILRFFWCFLGGYVFGVRVQIPNLRRMAIFGFIASPWWFTKDIMGPGRWTPVFGVWFKTTEARHRFTVPKPCRMNGDLTRRATPPRSLTASFTP